MLFTWNTQDGLYILSKGKEELLHFPGFICQKQFAEIVVFLFLFHLFNLLHQSRIVSRSIHIANHTECNREIRTFHQRQFQLQSVVFAVSIVYQKIFFCDTILANFHHFQSKAFLCQTKLNTFTCSLVLYCHTIHSTHTVQVFFWSLLNFK